jgi:hypothetical protein
MLLCSVEWADIVAITGSLATLVIAGLTFVSVRATRRAADAAVTAAHVAEQQLQHAHRPVVVPEQPSVEGRDLVVPMVNIGLGPALRVYARAIVKGLPEGVLGRFPRSVVSGVAAGERTALRFSPRSVNPDNITSLKVTYVDVTGLAYTTDAKWDRAQGEFTHVAVNEGDAARVPLAAGREARQAAEATRSRSAPPDAKDPI